MALSGYTFQVYDAATKTLNQTETKKILVANPITAYKSSWQKYLCINFSLNLRAGMLLKAFQQ